jgi:hypothetical protein
VNQDSNLWIPAVNNDGRFGRWAFIEIDDPWNAASALHSQRHLTVTAVNR